MKMRYRIGYFVILILVPSICFGDTADEIDDDEHAIDTVLSDAVSSGTNAVATYLNFNCPAGYRCLPVLECLPCDFGFFKSDTSSKLCTPCPTGCTTLRKGASSWRECVPMCPPGYETSECGKTCVRCHPGFYKSTWLNDACNQCPTDSDPDTVTLGMTLIDECYDEEEEEDTGEDSGESSNPEPTGDSCPASCSVEEYNAQALIPRVGSNCEQYCHCETDHQNGTYTYTKKDCAGGTMWIVGQLTCLHSEVSFRSCIDEGLVDDSDSSGDHTNECEDVCRTAVDAPSPDSAVYEIKPNTNCQRFCVCGYYTPLSTQQVYWQDVACDEEYFTFKSDLGHIECLSRNNSYSCPDDDDEDDDGEDSGEFSNPEPTGDSCPASCSVEEYNAQALIPRVGSNCEQYCHCETDHQNGTYTYTKKDCAGGTMWIVGQLTCLHSEVSFRSCIDEGLVDDSDSSGDHTNECEDVCRTAVNSSSPDSAVYEIKPNTNCQRFCVCGYYTPLSTQQVYWQDVACDEEYFTFKNYLGHIECLSRNNSYSCPDDDDEDDDGEDSGEFPNPEPTGDSCPASCSMEEYNAQALIPRVGSNCEQYCHCETDHQNGTYTYTKKDCAGGTMWIVGQLTCLHSEISFRSCIDEGLVDDSDSSEDQTYECEDVCRTAVGIDPPNSAVYEIKPNTNCQRFCVCGYYTPLSTQQVYWQDVACDDEYFTFKNHQGHIECLSRNNSYSCPDDYSSTSSDWSYFSSDYSSSSSDWSYPSSSPDWSYSSSSPDWSYSSSDYSSSSSDWSYSSPDWSYSSSDWSYSSSDWSYSSSDWSDSSSDWSYSSSDYSSSSWSSSADHSSTTQRPLPSLPFGRCPESCTATEYSSQTLIPLVGSTCTAYCQCENDYENGTFTFTQTDCPFGTMWIVGTQTCQTAIAYGRNCTSDGLTGMGNSECEEMCAYSIGPTISGPIFLIVPHTQCQRFCACGSYRTDYVYWQEIQCQGNSFAYYNGLEMVCNPSPSTADTCADYDYDYNP